MHCRVGVDYKCEGLASFISSWCYIFELLFCRELTLRNCLNGKQVLWLLSLKNLQLLTPEVLSWWHWFWYGWWGLVQFSFNYLAFPGSGLFLRSSVFPNPRVQCRCLWAPSNCCWHPANPISWGTSRAIGAGHGIEKKPYLLLLQHCWAWIPMSPRSCPGLSAPSTV